MTIAIHYTAVKPPSAATRSVFGLQVAIHDWLKAYFRYGSDEVISFLIGSSDEWDEVQAVAAQAGIDAKRLVALDRRFPQQNFAGLKTIVRLEPDTRNLLWQRELNGNFNFCGLAHAISGVEAGEVLQQYIMSPSQAGDAIICPSRAVQSVIRAFWDNYEEFLRARFGATYKCPVQLPVIPLGVDVEKFVAKTTPDKRAEQRKKLDIGDDDIVLLWVGRLSAAIKAHPLAMFQAAELAAHKTGAKIHLVMVGYFMPDEAEGQFKKMAADICAKAIVTFIAADDVRFPEGLWAAGDIFLSLVDNYQESFGLTPIEAMAAGLPRVLSDWDGYRDSVRDGEDGFLVRTTQPPAGNGLDLTAQVLSEHESYGGFLAKGALTVAVDAEQAAERIAQLIGDKNLRATMADKARARVRAIYDWKNIIPLYENLWRDNAVRHIAPPKIKYPSALPTLPDPYTMYETFPTARLQESDKLGLAMYVGQIAVLWAHYANNYGNDIMVAPTDISALLNRLGHGGEATIAALFAEFSALDRPRLWRTIAWLLKLGIVKKV